LNAVDYVKRRGFGDFDLLRVLAGCFAVAFGNLPFETQAFLRRIPTSLRDYDRIEIVEVHAVFIE